LSIVGPKKPDLNERMQVRQFYLPYYQNILGY